MDGFVRPAYAVLHDKSSAMVRGAAALCEAPSQAALDAARRDFSDLVAAWSAVETIHFGPITEENRLERMLFWPDRKGIGLKQVQSALADGDAGAADPVQLARKSVAMQGLGALEFVLFGSGAETLAGQDDPYRCAYGKAVAQNIETMAGAVSAAWNDPDGFAAQWSNPGPRNALYRNGNEAVTQLVGVFIDGLEMIRDVRLKGFFGGGPEADKPKQALYWRSRNTGMALAANMAGLDALFTASKLGEALPEDDRWIAQSIHVQLANAAADAQAAAGPIDKALADAATRKRLEHFALVTTSLSNLFGARLTGAFGLTAGFSSLDGD